jgi:hypothetical protein
VKAEANIIRKNWTRECDIQELSTPCATRFVVDVSQLSVVFLKKN